MNRLKLLDIDAALAPAVNAMRQRREPEPVNMLAGGYGYDAPAYGPSYGGENPEQHRNRFRDRLAMTESGGRYGVVNSLGYTGRYQFGPDRLEDFNRATGKSYTLEDIRTKPVVEEEVFDWHESDIDDFIWRNGLDQSGFSLNAMRAVAHLGGKGGLLKFVRSGGSYNPSDAYGTSLADYARTHG